MNATSQNAGASRKRARRTDVSMWWVLTAFVLVAAGIWLLL
jgi:hypothetical protein